MNEGSSPTSIQHHYLCRDLRMMSLTSSCCRRPGKRHTPSRLRVLSPGRWPLPLGPASADERYFFIAALCSERKRICSRTSVRITRLLRPRPMLAVVYRTMLHHVRCTSRAIGVVSRREVSLAYAEADEESLGSSLRSFLMLARKSTYALDSMMLSETSGFRISASHD